MAQNIYDTDEFFRGYSQLPRSVHGLNGAPEWQAIRELLPNLTGKRVVDLGCGFGWFARWARLHGAASVLGLDISENMIGRARAETSDATIEYGIADLDTLDLPANSFDLTYSSLAFHYITDFAMLTRTIHRSLVSKRASRLHHRASDLYGRRRSAMDGRCRGPQDLAGQRLLPRG